MKKKMREVGGGAKLSISASGEPHSWGISANSPDGIRRGQRQLIHRCMRRTYALGGIQHRRHRVTTPQTRRPPKLSPKPFTPGSENSRNCWLLVYVSGMFRQIKMQMRAVKINTSRLLRCRTRRRPLNLLACSGWDGLIYARNFFFFSRGEFTDGNLVGRVFQISCLMNILPSLFVIHFKGLSLFWSRAKVNATFLDFSCTKLVEIQSQNDIWLHSSSINRRW